VTEYRIEVRVTPRRGILDRRGTRWRGALATLGFRGVRDVHVGRLIVFHMDAESEGEARSAARRCAASSWPTP
jgi:phosphoribosylformylglycinamidine synthase